MIKLSKKLLAVFLIAVLLSGMVSFSAGAVEVSVGGKNVAVAGADIQKAIADLGSNVGTVTVTGTLSGATTIMTLDIPVNVTVEWKAVYSGTANPLIDLKGNGTFKVITDGDISNTSTSSSTAIRANATSAEAEKGVKIIVSGGVVRAVLGSAIEGAGLTTTVEVTGGEVFNYATHNLRPVINMTHPDNKLTNVIVSGGEVSARAEGDTVYGYVIQTYGIVEIRNGTVYTKGGYGRGINLTGVDSEARISGGEIYATGVSGVAVSTATTAGVDVTRAKVIVSGGLVYATTGMAIRTTGKESTVTVSGGLVISYGSNISGNNNVIFTQNNAALGFTGVTGGGIAVAWNQAAGALRVPEYTYDAGTITHLIVSSASASASAVWAHNPSGRDGINYSLDGVSWELTSFDGDIVDADGLVAFNRVTVREASWIVDRDEYEFPSEYAGWVRVISGQFAPPPSVAPYTSTFNETFTVTNNGDGDITDFAATLSLGLDSAFEIVSPLSPGTINEGGSANVIVKPKDGHLSAPVPHPFEDELIITGNGVDPLKVKLSVTVYPTFMIGFGAPSIDFRQENNTPFPLGSRVDVRYGEDITILLKPSAPTTHFLEDVHVADIFGATQGYPGYKSIGATGIVTFTDVTSDHSIAAVIRTEIGGPYVIMAFAAEGGGGRFLQDLRNEVPRPGGPGVDRTFNVRADPGYVISRVVVDTQAQNVSDNSTSFDYTFYNVATHHVITATFERSHYNIGVSFSGGGNITKLDGSNLASGDFVEVDHGQDLALVLSAEPGYKIGSVRIDGSPAPTTSTGFIRYEDSYIQLLFVDKDHDIVVTFVLDEVSTPPGETEEPDEETEEPDEPPPSTLPPGGDVAHILDTGNHIQYIRGVGNYLFQPGRDMTRAEVAQMFYNLLLEQDVEITVRFPDEPPGAWHAKAVFTMASLGIIKGYPDGSFRPENSVTRAEFVTMAVRFAHSLPEPKHLPFTDVPEAHWAYEDINAAVQLGWITGYNDGSFQPGRQISRAEAVTVVNRMLGRVADRAYINSHPELTQFSDVPQSHWAYYDIMEAFNAHDYVRDDDGVEHWID